MLATPCPTCTSLLVQLSGASERLFDVSSELSAAAIAWGDDSAGPPSEELMLRAQSLRAECSVIRLALVDHRNRWHRESASAA